MKFAYADPPYLGQSRHYDHPNAKDCDNIEWHHDLITRLERDYSDGWVLSCSSPSLRHLLPACPVDTRVGAWVKPFHAFKKGVRPAYAWEPVLFRGGRNRNHPPPEKGGKATTPKDFFVTADVVSANITLKRGMTGAKPDAFALWVLDLLNVQPEDTIDDLFPGSGAIGAAWKTRDH